LEIAAANTNSSSNSSPFVGMVARSCPKPIVMPRRSRQGSLAHHDELSVFVPPHELAASSLLDPTNVSGCREQGLRDHLAARGCSSASEDSSWAGRLDGIDGWAQCCKETARVCGGARTMFDWLQLLHV
jgi:hypothetical protein